MHGISLRICIATQQLEVLQQPSGSVLHRFPCSTGAAGTGSTEGSGCTPLGHFCLCSKHGENAPLHTVFRSRLPVGLYPAAARGEDAILARILCLHGLEPHNANTRSRYIYIHGTADTARLGSPVSHGCIRLSPQHACTLYTLAPIGTPIRIVEQ